MGLGGAAKREKGKEQNIFGKGMATIRPFRNMLIEHHENVYRQEEALLKLLDEKKEILTKPMSERKGTENQEAKYVHDAFKMYMRNARAPTKLGKWAKKAALVVGGTVMGATSVYLGKQIESSPQTPSMGVEFARSAAVLLGEGAATALASIRPNLSGRPLFRKFKRIQKSEDQLSKNEAFNIVSTALAASLKNRRAIIGKLNNYKRTTLAERFAKGKL
ncbi:MAG: hypothetical protein V1835_05480 [Candidatus Micrarchaeota archaeon]